MRCVLVGAADIKNYRRCKKYFSDGDFFIFCDGGLRHCKKLGVKPDLIVGDFDSCGRFLPRLEKTPCKNTEASGFHTEKTAAGIEVIHLPCDKDDTDLFFAAKEAVKRGFDDFLILGAVGGRFDHSLVNISVLLHLFNSGKSAMILDDRSEMEIVGKNPKFVSDAFSFFSLLCIDGRADGVEISGAKWNMDGGKIYTDWQFACSNQVVKGMSAKVSVADGVLLLVRDF